ncbi:MAG: transglutaminase-like domain-containing protein, partial [Gammaproteobacteria bacterium]|nr:transglutaminase-like domain-containing protein [Gammaproteobacteria bacterium]
WAPESPPGSFLAENQRSRYFSELVEALLGDAQTVASTGDWERALLLGRHLSKHKINGEGILSSVENTYRKIVDEGSGYCADYAQVFNGLSFSADIPVREWGMSFDGFAGEGHSFNEVFDRTSGRWIFIDTFYSFYLSDSASRQPLSAAELQQFLLTRRPDHEVNLHPIVAEKFGFQSKDKALEYYRRGASEFFLYLGNNVFSYDAHPVVRMAAPLSRAAEQAVAILFGIHPKILVVRTDENSLAVDKLIRLRRIILAEALVVLSCCVLLLGYAVGYVGRIRSRQHEKPTFDETDSANHKTSPDP